VSFLDDLIGYRDVLGNLVLLPRRKILRFVGATVADDPTNSATLITVSGAGGVPAGANTEVQFNNSGAFGASTDFEWDDALSTLSLGDGGSGRLKLFAPSAASAMSIATGGAGGDEIPVYQMAQTVVARQANVAMYVGNRNPNGAISATRGSMYMQGGASGDTWLNIDGATGWTSLATPVPVSQSRTFVVDSAGTPSTTVFTTLAGALTAANALDGVTTIQQMTTETPTGALNFTDVEWVAGAASVPVDLSGASAVGLPPRLIGSGLEIIYTNASPFWTVAGAHSMTVEGSAVLGTQVFTVAGPGHLFDVTATGSLGVLYRAAVCTGKVQTVAAGGSVLMLGEGGQLRMDFDGNGASYIIVAADGCVLNATVPLTAIVRRSDSLLNVAVHFSGAAIPNLLAHVDTLAGSFTGTLPDPSSSDDFEQGQSVLFVDSAGNANANPFTVATTGGTIDELPSYALNKAGDVVWAFPKNPFSTNGYVAITKWPRFEGEFVVNSAGTSNAFTTLADALKVTDGYPGGKTILALTAVSSASSRAWNGYTLKGPWTFGVGANWVQPPQFLTDGSFTFAATVFSLTPGGSFPRISRSTLTNVLETSPAFTHSAAGTVVVNLTDVTLVGSPSDGLFRVSNAASVLEVHLYGKCTLDANVFARVGAGSVEVIVHDPTTTVATQALIGAAFINVHQAPLVSEFTATADLSTTSTTFVAVAGGTLNITAPHRGRWLIQATTSASNTNNGRLAGFRILLDATPIAKGGASLATGGSPDSVSMSAAPMVEAGAHTVVLQWRTDANTLQARAATAPFNDTEFINLTAVQL